MTNIKHLNYGIYGTKITPATWTGASAPIAGVNVVGVKNHRCYNGPGKTPIAGIYTAGGGNLDFDLLTFEGGNGSIHHFLDQTVGTFTAESCCTLSNLYFESAGASRAAIKFEADKGDYFVNKWNNQVAYADMPVFIEAAHKSAPPAGVRQLFVRVENAATQQGNGGILPKFRNTSQHPQGYGPRWVVQYANMPSNSWTSPKLNVAANWDTSTPFSSIPDDAQIINYIPSPI